MSEAISIAVLSLSLLASVSALGLRLAEARNPDPDDIAVRAGLGHMLTGLFAWAGLTCALVAGLYLFGAMRAVLTALPAALAFVLTRSGDRVYIFYRYQMPLALVGLLLAILLWLILISQVQGDPNV